MTNGIRNLSWSTGLTYMLGMSSSPVWVDAEAPLTHGTWVWGFVLVLFMQPQGFGV